MELVKENWNKKSTEDFDKFLYENRLEDKIDFTKRVVNTKMDVLGIKIPTLRVFAKEISKGNYISFLDNMTNKYYETTIVCSLLINKIDDIDKKDKYLKKLIIDNWSTVDILSFKTKGKEREYLDYSKKLIKDKDPYRRRIGVRILFNYTENDDLINDFVDVEKE